MDLIDDLLEWAKYHSKNITKGILIGVGFITVIANAIECINTGATFQDYFLLVGVLGASVFIMLLSKSDEVLCIVLSLTGVIMLMVNDSTLNAGVFGFVFAKRIANDLKFSVGIYIVVGLTIIAKHTINPTSATDTVCYIFAAYAILFIDYILIGNQK